MGAALRRIQIGSALSAFGNGFTVPFLFVYVARVRDLGAATAGTCLAAFAVAALIVLPFTGRVIDRRGPLPVVVVGSIAAALGSFGLGLAGTAPTVLAGCALMGAGIAVIQPALATMIVRCSTRLGRSRAFATQFFLSNLGLGLGGMIGGLLVDEDRAGSFVLLFSIEALMFLVLGVVVGTTRLPGGTGEHSPAGPAGTPVPADAGGGLRDILAHRAMLLLCVLGFVMFFAVYGQFEAGLAAYAVEVTRVSATTLGFALAANTAAIVAAQYAVLRWVERRRRSRVIALVGVIWTVAWLAAGLSGLVPHAQAVAVGLLISTYALFGLGEALLSPTVAPLVADLAPAGRIGRYNAAFALVKQLALAVGPAFGGLLAAAGWYAPYLVIMVVCSVAVSALALLLGRHLTAVQDRPALGRGIAASSPGPVPASVPASADGAERTVTRVV
ncbi:MFS transporter [Streptomyces calidiresistens]|uniref:MFS transporter n=2 Tax=Streptomyces calidiresistens TaxID=1485586 RepID=A0A7W3T1R8_9ACTN|nr:MFS transporter [Streptomyces calidiresistens]